MSVFFLLVGLALYCLPMIVAIIDKKAATGGIIILNLFLGWTILGWIGALIWAVTSEIEAQKANRYRQK